MKALHKGFTALVLFTAVAAGATMDSGNAWAYRGGDRDGGCACSQRDGGWKGHGQQGDRFAKALDLSKEQTEQVKAIFRKHRDETAPLRKEMVRRHKGTVLRSAARFAHNPAELEDLGQETFLRVYRDLRSFRGDGRRRTFRWKSWPLLSRTLPRETALPPCWPA